MWPFWLYIALGLIVSSDELYLRIQSNVLFNIPPLVALALTLRRSKLSEGRERWGWLCISALLATWQVGDWTYSYYDLALGSSAPFPGFADIGYYAGYFAFMAAVLLLAAPQSGRIGVYAVVDAAVIVLVGVMIEWEYVARSP